MLELTHIRKAFGSIQALRDVSVSIRSGQVHGIVGANGSGKSTLMKIISGYYPADAGELRHRGSLDFTVAAIHQDLSLRQDLSVTENIGVGAHYGAKPKGPIRWKREKQQAQKYLDVLGASFSPDDLVSGLAPADRAAVAIARALRKLDAAGGERLLIVDETTAYFSTREIRKVAGILQTLSRNGCAVIFISHNLRVVLTVCDVVTVLRNGESVGRFATAEDHLSVESLVYAMLGRTLSSFYPEVPDRDDSLQPILEVSALEGEGVDGFDMTARPGEIIGVTGLVGSGFDLIPYMIAGSNAKQAGEVLIEGRKVTLTAASASRHGISLVPGNRAQQGLWMAGKASANYSITRLREIWHRFRLDLRMERVLTLSAMDQFRVSPTLPDAPIAYYSGGNQQKLLLASRFDLGRTRILLLHEPTQGVDLGARRDIFDLLKNAAEQGIAIVIFSSDQEELVNICQRIIVVAKGGRVSTEMSTVGLSEEDLMTACMLAK